MPRQHLPQHHGPIRHAGSGQPPGSCRPFLHQFRRHQHGGDRKPGTPRNQGEVKRGGDSLRGSSGGADAAVGL